MHLFLNFSEFNFFRNKIAIYKIIYKVELKWKLYDIHNVLNPVAII